MSNPMVFSIENRKGGVGKTTTTVTLGVGLAQRLLAAAGGDPQKAERVLIIDMDPQSDSARALGINPNGRCVSNVLRGDGGIEPLRENIISANREADGGPYRPNLYILPSSDELSAAKEDLLSEIAIEAARMVRRGGDAGGPRMVTVLDDKFGPAKRAFKYILIDCPPTLDMLQQAVHYFADAAIVPVKVDFHGASATGRHTANILADQAAGIDITIAAVIPTFVDLRNNLTKAMLINIKETYGRSVTRPIPHTVNVAEAPAKGGLTITEYMPETYAAKAYDELTERIYTWR